MKKLIGFVGYAGSGKTTIANATGATRISFSEPIENALIALGVPEKLVRDKREWEIPLDLLCGKTIRYTAQTLGTEWGRNLIGNDLWLNIALQKADNLRYENNVIIDNVRFPNEFDKLRDSGAILVAIRRNSVMPKNLADIHPSEKYIADLQSNCLFSIDNDGDIVGSINSMMQLMTPTFTRSIDANGT